MELFDYAYTSNLNVLNEVYYGKPQSFKKAEKLLEKIIQDCHGVMKGTVNHSINETKEVHEFKKIMEKELNIGEFDISFYMITMLMPTAPPNAFTIPSFVQFFKKSNNNKKLVNNKNMFVGVNVDIALITNLQLTAQELMAVILHEIGHCMDATFFTLLAKLPSTLLYPLFFKVSPVVSSTDLLKFFTKFFMSLGPVKKTTMDADKMLNDALMEMSSISSILKHLIIISNTIKQIIPNIRIEGLLALLRYPEVLLILATNPKNLFGYAGEKFADSFATSYGYGAPLSTFLEKLETNKNYIMDAIHNVPILNIGVDLVSLSARMLTCIFDPHPQNPTRIISQLQKLKRDLKDPNLSPAIRKELEANIAEMEDVIDNFILDANRHAKQGTLVTYMYQFIVIKVFQGKVDPREILNIGGAAEL